MNLVASRNPRFKVGDKVQVVHVTPRETGHSHQRRLRQIGTVLIASWNTSLLDNNKSDIFYSVKFSDGKVLGYRENELGPAG